MDDNLAAAMVDMLERIAKAVETIADMHQAIVKIRLDEEPPLDELTAAGRGKLDLT